MGYAGGAVRQLYFRVDFSLTLKLVSGHGHHCTPHFVKPQLIFPLFRLLSENSVEALKVELSNDSDVPPEDLHPQEKTVNSILS